MAEWRSTRRRMSIDQAVADTFHRAYYDSARTTWGNTYWQGTLVLKCPLDLWIYQEIICETKPEVVIETGTFQGGSALFLASIFDLLGRGRVLSIDLEAFPARRQHPRITYIEGPSTSTEVLQLVRQRVGPQDKSMGVLDSDHSREHVLREIEAYKGFVSLGCYSVVEDTNINGHPLYPEFVPGPMEAVAEFLATESGFVQDRSREKFGLTFCPGGYLRRIR
jgi:cephalosporin hydroxylase